MFQPNCFTRFISLIYLSRRLFPAALVFLVLIALSNYTMIFFSCWGLHTYGPWLSKYHKVDLWLHRVLVRASKLMFRFFNTTNTNLCFVLPKTLWCALLLRLQVQNGVAVYATWTTVASMVNLDIVLTYDTKMSPTESSTISLAILTGLLIVWWVSKRRQGCFSIEYIYLWDEFVNFAGSFWKTRCWINTWDASSLFSLWWFGLWRECLLRTTTLRIPPAITSLLVRSSMSRYYVPPNRKLCALRHALIIDLIEPPNEASSWQLCSWPWPASCLRLESFWSSGKASRSHFTGTPVPRPCVRWRLQRVWIHFTSDVSEELCLCTGRINVCPSSFGSSFLLHIICSCIDFVIKVLHPKKICIFSFVSHL